MKAALTVLTFKINSGSYGTDAAPTTTANVLLAQNVDINPLTMDTDEWRPVTNKFGGGEKIVGAKWCSVNFDFLMGGGGTPLGNVSSVPNYDPVLRASAMARTITSGAQIAYNNIDSGEEEATMYYYMDGTLQKMVGLRGSVEWKGDARKPIVGSFKGIGLNVPMTDTALPAITLPTPPRPLAMNKANTGITIDTTYIARVSSFTLSQGNDVQYRNLSGREDVVVVDRQMSGKITIEMPTVAEKDFLGASGICTNATPVALFVTHGGTPGNTVLFDTPQVQLFNPKPKREAGIMMLDCDMHVVRNNFAIFCQ